MLKSCSIQTLITTLVLCAALLPAQSSSAGDFDLADWYQLLDENGGQLSFDQAFNATNQFGATYATTPGTIGDAKLTLVYNSITGALSVEGPAGEQFKSLSIASASGQFNLGVANWLGAAGVGFTSNTVGLQGFATNTALGQTFLISNGYAIGAILDPGISEAFLLQDLTIQYGIQGLTGTRVGDLGYFIPEPSLIFSLLAGGGAALGLIGRRRKLALSK